MLDPSAPGTAGDPSAGGISTTMVAPRPTTVVPAIVAVPAGPLVLVVALVVRVVTTVPGVAQVPVGTTVVVMLAPAIRTVRRRVARVLVFVACIRYESARTPAVREVRRGASGKRRSSEREECSVDTHGGGAPGSGCRTLCFSAIDDEDQQRQTQSLAATGCERLRWRGCLW